MPGYAGIRVAWRPFVPRVGEHDKSYGARLAREHPVAGHERSSRACCPASRVVLARRGELCPRRQLSQRERERERERRVSDADASYYGPVLDAKTLNCANPQ